jgi:salicylate biosynthesis isochorismate synthase/menaquinone-specific isochorismate synthase
VTLTLAALCRPDDDPAALQEELEGRARDLRQAPLPLLDPDPVARMRVASAMPPEHYEGAVARGVERIRAGAFDKIVLAREVQVHAPSPHDAAAVLSVLREAFRECNVFAVGRGKDTFIAASPELLVRREGVRAEALALAGSTRRSADPSVDAHLGEQLLRSAKDREEQAIVVRRIVSSLRALSVWVTSADEPVLARMANIQHLATPIRVARTGRPTAPRSPARASTARPRRSDRGPSRRSAARCPAQRARSSRAPAARRRTTTRLRAARRSRRPSDPVRRGRRS